MNIQITKYELKLYKDNIPCKCEHCNKIFGISKSDAYRVFKGTKNKRFCSNKCKNSYKTKLFTTEVQCKNCSVVFTKHNCALNENNFCSQTCSAKFNNKNKKFGVRRSKLELFLETELSKIYNQLEIRFNKKDTINSELDIYIPQLKLAFELNGIFHYKPIYGLKKLEQIKINDSEKSKACLDNNIELHVIDCSTLTHYNNMKALPFLEKVKIIIDNKMEQAKGVEPI